MKLLLLDAGWDHTPYLVRELARENFEVSLASPTPSDNLFLARYCKQIHAPWDSMNAAGLSALIDKSDADMILPLSEDIMDILWEMSEERTRRVFPPTNHAQRQLLRDRTKMYEFVASFGVPVPGMMALEREGQLDDAAERYGFPYVLRGTQGLAGLQVRVVFNGNEAQKAYAQLLRQSPGAPFAQEYINGNRFLVGGMFNDGDMLQLFSQTTIEAVRPPTGPSIRIRSVRDEVLQNFAMEVFRQLSWTGLACAEFMRNQRGEYRFLEINPRPWAAIYGAHRCGVPLLRTFARYLNGDRSKYPIDFEGSSEVVLFPQFLSYRVATGNFPSPHDARYCLTALKGAPWGSPALLLHMLRRVFWSRRG